MTGSGKPPKELMELACVAMAASGQKIEELIAGMTGAALAHFGPLVEVCHKFLQHSHTVQERIVKAHKELEAGNVVRMNHVKPRVDDEGDGPF